MQPKSQCLLYRKCAFRNSDRHNYLSLAEREARTPRAHASIARAQPVANGRGHNSANINCLYLRTRYRNLILALPEVGRVADRRAYANGLTGEVITLLTFTTSIAPMFGLRLCIGALSPSAGKARHKDSKHTCNRIRLIFAEFLSLPIAASPLRAPRNDASYQMSLRGSEATVAIGRGMKIGMDFRIYLRLQALPALYSPNCIYNRFVYA